MKKLLIALILTCCLLPASFAFADESMSMDTDGIASQIDQNADEIGNVFDNLLSSFFDMWDSSSGLSTVASFFTDGLAWIPVEFWWLLALSLGLLLVRKAVSDLGK